MKKLFAWEQKGVSPVCKQARELKKYLTGKMDVFVDEIDFVIGIIQRKICSGCDMQEVFLIVMMPFVRRRC